MFSQVSQFALVLLSKDFNPEKYATLCRLFSIQYKTSGNPVSLLESYLSVVTRGYCENDENEQIAVSDFPQQHAYAKSCVKGKLIFKMKNILYFINYK